MFPAVVFPTTSTKGSSEVIDEEVQGDLMDFPGKGLPGHFAVAVAQFCVLLPDEGVEMRRACREGLKHFTEQAKVATAWRLLTDERSET